MTSWMRHSPWSLGTSGPRLASSRQLFLVPLQCHNHQCSHCHSNLKWSAPPQPSPLSYRPQQNQPWQPGPSTSTDYQGLGWPSFAPSLSALNTSGLSSYLYPTAPADESSTLSTPDGQRPSNRASSFGDRPTTSDVVRSAQHVLNDSEDEPSK